MTRTCRGERCRPLRAGRAERVGQPRRAGRRSVPWTARAGRAAVTAEHGAYAGGATAAATERGGGAAHRRARGRRAGAGALLAMALLLSGCASMPGSGPVQRVESSRRSEGEGESQVRVFGVPPEERAQPHEIVSGFLEAV